MTSSFEINKVKTFSGLLFLLFCQRCFYFIFFQANTQKWGTNLLWVCFSLNIDGAITPCLGFLALHQGKIILNLHGNILDFILFFLTLINDDNLGCNKRICIEPFNTNLCCYNPTS